MRRDFRGATEGHEEKIVSGDGNPMMMFMTGKVKAKGDLGIAAQIVKLFDIPKA